MEARHSFNLKQIESQLNKAINDHAIENNIDQFCSGLTQEHKPQQQSGCNITMPLNCCNCICTFCDWLPNNTPVHLTKINLDETPSNANIFGEANIAELPRKPRNLIDTESEEKSQLNSNQQTNNPDCLLPFNLTNLELKP